MYVQWLFICVCVYMSYVFCEHLNLPEGSPCFFNGANGRCVSIYKCLSADYDINRNMNPPICDFDGMDPIICCTDCNLVNDTRNVLYNSNLGFLHLNGQIAHDQCLNNIDQLSYKCKEQGASLRSSIMNEDKTCYNHVSKPTRRTVEPSRNEYPHMAILGFGEDWQSAKWLCSGSIISHNFVLTAAHCIQHPQFGLVNYFGVGMSHRSDINIPGLWQRYRVSRFIVHPQFNASLYHDIALLESGTPIIFNERVMPACLAPPSTSLGADSTDDTGIFTSWGNLERRKGLDVLLTIPLEKFSEEECLKEYPPNKYLKEGYNHTTQMCYGRRDEAVEKCEGDTGGPVLLSSFCAPTLMAVTIYSRGCGISPKAGIYTRISYYLPWIESHVWP